MSTPEAPSPIPPPPPPPPPQPQPRKVPPPCWTHEETLALIESYRDRWLSLRRGYLRTPDWDSVAASVSGRCRHLSLSVDKSSAQCRHKIEKLRQRYRAERQRCLALPGKFVSSWIFFKKLDFIDDISSSAAGSDQTTETKIGAAGKFRVKSKSIGDHSLASIGFVGSKNFGSVSDNSNPVGDFDHDFDGGVDGGDGFYRKTLGDRPSVFIGSKNYVKNDGNSSANLENDHGMTSGFYVNSLGNRSYVPPGFKAKKFDNFDGKFNSNSDFNHENDDGYDVGDEFFGRSLGGQSSIPLRLRPKNYSKINGITNPYVHMDQDEDDEIDTGAGFRAKTPGNWHSVSPGFRSKNSYNFNGDSSSKLDSSVLNGSSSRSKFAKKSGGGGMKREMDPVLELVSSIKLLGEGFVKMEKMKMDMAMEIEKMRMGMEMKRNEMILESQRQIVDAFLKVFLEKNKKAKVMVSPES